MRHTAQGRAPVMPALGLSGRAVTHHVLPLGQNLEEGVVPLQDVGVQQVSRREGPLAEGADVSVQSVVVVLVILQGVEHLAAAGHLTRELGHPGRGTPGGDAIPQRTERRAPCHHSPLSGLIKLRIFSCKPKSYFHNNYIFTDKRGGGEARHAGSRGGTGRVAGRAPGAGRAEGGARRGQEGPLAGPQH